MEATTLEQIEEDLVSIKQKITAIEEEIGILKNTEPEVREEYIEKLKKIEKGKFHKFNTKEEFLNFLENEV